jgi:hypothetical protein
MKTQLHIGKLAIKTCTGITSIWTSNDGGKTYWSGNWYNRTPKQLKQEAESVLRDLRVSNPRLFKANAESRRDDDKRPSI